MHRGPFALIACALAVVGCGDYTAPSEVVNGTAVASLQATGANFSQYKTFTVTNTIQVTDNSGTTSEQYTKDVPQIVDQVKSNMTNLGYTYVPFSSGVQADLVIGLYAYKGSQSYGGYYCGYWYWGYYPYNCAWSYYGTYTFGTLVLRMADFKNAPMPASPSDKLTLVWGSAIYGVLAQPYTLQRVLAGIDTAFAQSPYLKKQ